MFHQGGLWTSHQRNGLGRNPAIEQRPLKPQRREERGETSEDSGPQPIHRLVIALQAAETGLSLRSSRLCGLMGLRSIAWSRHCGVQS